MKFGPIKRQHGRVNGLDAVLDRIVTDCPHVTRIVPGRMGRKRGRTAPGLSIQYATARGSGSAAATGLKCIFTNQGSWQEVFLVCSDTEAARAWLESSGIVI